MENSPHLTHSERSIALAPTLRRAGVSGDLFRVNAQRERASHLVCAVRVVLLCIMLVWCACLAGGAAQAGEFGLTTTNTAPSTIIEGQRDDVLRIAFSNPETTAARLTSLGLMLESTAGTPLTGPQGTNLISAIEIHEDTNGSGGFELTADALIATLFAPSPAPDGTLSFSCASSNPADVEVAAGQTRNYFVVVRFSAGASAQLPPTLRLTHLTNGAARSTANEAGSGTPLTLQPVANVSSSTVTAIFNSAPTTSGIANVVIFEPTIPTTIPLFASFQDAEDAPGQMTYDITGNSNPGLFAFVGIDPVTGLLALDPTAGGAGSSQITVRATDSGGKTVATTFGVAVALLRTYAEWAAFHFGANNLTGSAMGDDPTGSGVSNFAKYAFGLDPNKVGDRAGLPQLERTGNSAVFTHLKPKYATDLAYTYEFSTDLATWTTAVNGVHVYQNTKDLSNGLIRVNLLVLVPGPKVFLRARADQTAGSGPFPPISPPPPPPTGGGGGGSGSAQFVQGTAVFDPQIVLTTAAQAANWVVTADIDGDGFRDVVSASFEDQKVAWYRNNGDETFASQQVITTANVEPSTVAAADLDGDGLRDVVTGSHGDNKLAWHKNLGGGNFGPQQVVSTAYNYITSVAIADFDNDNKADLLCTGQYDSRIAWHRNLGAGNFGPQQIIGVLSGPNRAWAPYQAVAGDIDGDGFLDVVSASTNDDKIAWYRNNGNGTFGPQQVITTSAERATTVATEDFDGDGRLDVICGSAYDNIVSFFRNNGDGTFGPRVVLTSTAGGVFSVIPADLNGDGAPDVVSASYTDDKISWYENLGGTFGLRQNISTIADGAVSVTAADFNGDGKLDVASASQNDSKIAVYLNRGVSGTGQVAVATANTAPAGVLEGGSASLLRVAVTNYMGAGANNVQLAKLAFLFESSPGVPLTAVEANKLIDRLQIFADTNGSNSFEPASDQLVEATQFLPLAAGRVYLPLPTVSPELQVPPGATRTFFVVVKLKPEAASEVNPTFRIKHLTQGTPRTIAKDSQTGAPRFIGPVADAASSFITAQPNQAPVTTGIPSITVFDTVVASSLALTPYFNDAESGANGLTYAITANSNPSLLGFAGISTPTGALLLNYKHGVGGSTLLTIRATDAQGKSISTNLAVNVLLVTSLQTWSNLFGGGGNLLAPQGGSAELLRYAFALNPVSPGDTGRLPQMSVFGQVRILSHFKYRYATDLAYQYEFSSDLENWSVAMNGVHYFEFTTDLPNGLQQSDLVILLDWPRVFFRPRATLIP